MGSDLIIAVIAGASSVLGSSVGVIASSRLTNYRLEKLESKVDEIAKRDDDIIVLKEQMFCTLKMIYGILLCIRRNYTWIDLYYILNINQPAISHRPSKLL